MKKRAFSIIVERPNKIFLQEKGSSLWIILFLLFITTPLVLTLYENFSVRSQWLKMAHLGHLRNSSNFSEWIKSLVPNQEFIFTMPPPLCQDESGSKSQSQLTSTPQSICRVTSQHLNQLPEPLRVDLPLEICSTRAEQWVKTNSVLAGANNCLSLGDGFQGVVVGNLSLSEFNPRQLFVSGYLDIDYLTVSSDVLLVAGGDIIISGIKWGNPPQSNALSLETPNDLGSSLYLYSLTGSVKLATDSGNILSLSGNQGVIKVVERLSEVPVLLRRGLFAPPPPLGIILSL